LTATHTLLHVASALCALAATCACGGSPAQGPAPVTPSAANNSATTLTGDTQPVLATSRVSPDLMFARAQLWASDRDSREAALESIAAAQPDLLQHAWPLLLTDADAKMRQIAVDHLTDMGGQKAIELLETATYDPHPAVRQAAYEGLSELGATD